MDGRYAYVQKKPGVLALVAGFRSTDFLLDGNSHFLVKSSHAKNRMIFESIPNYHSGMSFNKNHNIFVADFGKTTTRTIGEGKNAKLHLEDEWISYFDSIEEIIFIQNLVTQKIFKIKTSKKQNPFFLPQVEMVNSSTVLYTDINEQGYSALIAFNLKNLQSSVIYKSTQSATSLELCRHDNYVALGEFPFEGVNRGSSIQMLTLGGTTNLTGFENLYTTVEHDIGNIVCLKDSIYFVKSINENPNINFRITEAFKLDLKSKKINQRSDLKFVTQILEMDGRVLLPFRNKFFVLEGISNLGEDVLKSRKEELKFDI